MPLVGFLVRKTDNIENVVAIGDNYNDIPMLEVAGYSFAMGNAEEAVKQVAKYTTATSYEDGVAKAIQTALALAEQQQDTDR